MLPWWNVASGAFFARPRRTRLRGGRSCCRLIKVTRFRLGSGVAGFWPCSGFRVGFEAESFWSWPVGGGGTFPLSQTVVCVLFSHAMMLIFFFFCVLDGMSRSSVFIFPAFFFKMILLVYSRKSTLYFFRAWWAANEGSVWKFYILWRCYVEIFEKSVAFDCIHSVHFSVPNPVLLYILQTSQKP